MRVDLPVEGPVVVTARTRASDLVVAARDDVEAAAVVLTPVRGGQAAQDLVTATRVDLHGSTLVIEVPRSPGSVFGSAPQLLVEVTVPTGSSLDAEAGSGDIRTSGALHRVEVRSGSGDVTVGEGHEVQVGSGSGDVLVEESATLRLTTGSGDVRVRRVSTSATLRTGSGDILLDDGVAVSASTGSGDVVLGRASGALRLASGSGDLQVRSASDGEVTARTASGDVVVGVPHGTAALLDCSSVSGRVTADLEPADGPADGEGAVQLRLRTVSGDIRVVRA